MSQTSLQTPRAARGSFAAVPEALASGLELRRAQTAALAGGIDALCAACADLAARIAAGGRLYVLGSGSARADARHLALEFLHPVIVGKRAVPALALDPAEEPRAIERSGSACDAAIAVVGSEPAAEVWRALSAARERGLLALVLSRACAGDARPPGVHWLDPGASDPLLAKEGRVATYHLLWELTHVLLEDAERVGAPDAASFAQRAQVSRSEPKASEDHEVGEQRPSWEGQLYPFLDASRATRETVRADLLASGAAKLRALEGLRDAAVGGQAAVLARCAESIGEALRDGSQLWSFGNGGSQTDADWVAECFAGGRGGPAWRARSLAGDPAVLTALANDVGFERVFARQIAAFARAGDVALGISTSGSSENVVAGLAEAKRRGLLTVGLAGGDGGRLARSDDVDFLLVVPSDSVHRIQEVQATLYHLLYEIALSRAAPEDRRCDS